MAEIVMPRLSDTMEEGTILRWLVAEGEHVERGQEIVEIETDKATMTYESDLDGELHLLAAEGDTLPVGAVIASVGSADASAPNAVPEATAPTPQATVPPPATTPAPNKEGDRVKASPLARRIASEKDIDLHAISGTGPGGRIIRADVQAATDREPASTVEKPATAKGETTEVELSRTQQTIARRMAESKATIPHFALQTDIDMEQCVALRTELKRLGRADAPTYNDMVVKACALALREHPRANSSYRDGRLQLHGRVNVGVAVATDSDEPTGGALIVPTVFDADLKSLGEIARETRSLATRVRGGSITPPELGGGTFTVSNLGMFGVSAFTAIVNPPQAAILSVGAVGARAAVRDDEIVVRRQMTVTLACDHRILYGADAARFLARIRELLEQPAALTL
jgi:pyruvate dehydrogenase E2 component (dihydrolipoamide acetyltransferase)